VAVLEIDSTADGAIYGVADGVTDADGVLLTDAVAEVEGVIS
jgi:hypothetical protein